MSLLVLQRFLHIPSFVIFFFNGTATTEIYTLSLHDALPISADPLDVDALTQQFVRLAQNEPLRERSEEHTSELQSPYDLVCRLLLEKKKEQNANCPRLTEKKNHNE